MKQKIVFVIPGFRQKITQKGYRQVARVLKKEGFTPILITISWGQSTIFENTASFLAQYKKTLRKWKKEEIEVYFFGFSYGAMIALLVATKMRVTGLLLCSLSPFFREDLPKKLPKRISTLQLKRYNSFASIRSSLAKKVKAKRICMFYGANESKPLIARVTKTFHQFPQSQKYLLSIQNLQHNISDKKYITAIHYGLKTFL